MSEKHNSSGITMKDVLKSVIAGGSAGIIEVCCMYPLDVVKTRFELFEKKKKKKIQTKLFLDRNYISNFSRSSKKRYEKNKYFNVIFLALKFTCNVSGISS